MGYAGVILQNSMHIYCVLNSDLTVVFEFKSGILSARHLPQDQKKVGKVGGKLGFLMNEFLGVKGSY